MEMDWAKQTFTEYVFEKFLDGEFEPIVPLPPKEKPDEMALPAQPTLSLLAYSKVKQGGLVTLKTPDKVLLAWHDNPNHGLEFQGFLEEQRKNHFLDWTARLKMAKVKSQLRVQEGKAKSRQRQKTKVILCHQCPLCCQVKCQRPGPVMR